MNRRLALILLGIVLFVTVNQAQEGSDTQFWNLNTIDFALDESNENIRGVIFTDARLVDKVQNLADLRIGFGVKYKANDNWSITPSYIYRRIRLTGNDVNEHHFNLDIEGLKKFEKFSYDNRSRFEHRTIDSGRTDLTFYRNRSRVKIPVKSNGKTSYTPFVANDTWFEIQEVELFRNDLQLGVNKRFNKKLAADVYYLYRRDFQGGIKHQNVIGVNLSITLN